MHAARPAQRLGVHGALTQNGVASRWLRGEAVQPVESGLWQGSSEQHAKVGSKATQQDAGAINSSTGAHQADAEPAHLVALGQR